MMSFLIKSTVCLSLLLLAYLWLLEHEKINVFKRWFLIFCIIFSLAIPFTNLNFGPQFPLSKMSIVVLEDLIINQKAASTELDTGLTLWIFYFAGLIVMLYRFAKNILAIYKNIKNNKQIQQGNFVIVLMANSCLPHTFMNYIFINQADFESKNIPNEILEHEKTHAKQLHSFDVLFIEILKIIFWFNPIFHAYKNAIQRNHEFLADEKVTSSLTNISKYQTQLLDYVKYTQNHILTSNINYSLTKKRFTMMTKKVSLQTIIMKNALFTMIISCLVLLMSEKTIAQTTHTDNQNNEIYNAVEIKPEYPDGIAAFYNYFIKNLKVPANNKANGKLLMSFVVEKDGSLTDIKVIKDKNTNLGEQAIAVLKSCPKWNPGIQKGRPVRVQYTLPISIVVGK